MATANILLGLGHAGGQYYDIVGSHHEYPTDGGYTLVSGLRYKNYPADTTGSLSPTTFRGIIIREIASYRVFTTSTQYRVVIVLNGNTTAGILTGVTNPGRAAYVKVSEANSVTYDGSYTTYMWQGDGPGHWLDEIHWGGDYKLFFY